MVMWLNFGGLVLNLVGVILLGWAFRIEHNEGIRFDGKPAIALGFRSKKGIIWAWILIVLGNILQIISNFY